MDVDTQLVADVLQVDVGRDCAQPVAQKVVDGDVVGRRGGSIRRRQRRILGEERARPVDNVLQQVVDRGLCEEDVETRRRTDEEGTGWRWWWGARWLGWAWGWSGMGAGVGEVQTWMARGVRTSTGR